MKKTIKHIFMLLVISAAIVTGLVVGNLSENRMSILNKNKEDIPVISSSKELKKLIESSKNDYNTTKVFIEGKISSKLSVTDSSLDGKYIYIKKSFYNYEGKISEEEINNAKCASIKDVIFNTSNILFMNPDIMEENAFRKIVAVKNGQYGVMEANICIGEIKSGNFHSNKSAMELKAEQEVNITDTVLPFYIIWFLCVFILIVIFIINIKTDLSNNTKAKNSKINETTNVKEKIMVKQIVNSMIAEGTLNTSTGNWIFYYNSIKEKFHLTDEWFRAHLQEICDELMLREEIADVESDYESISIWMWLDNCPNVDE